MENSSFLNSKSWEKFENSQSHQTFRIQDQLFSQRQIPLGQYFIASRCQFKEPFLDLSIPTSCFLRLEPENQTSLEVIKKYAQSKHLILEATTTVQPRQSIIVDIHTSYENVIQNMKSKHRYNLRLAEKYNLQTDVYSQDLAAQFPRFWQLLEATATRQAFRTHPKQHYLDLLKIFSTQKQAHLLFVRLNGQDLASMLMITYHETATYLHGASSLEHKEMMAPYLLHAKAIQTAQKLGCSQYDLWGSAAIYQSDKEQWQEISGHSSAGTTRFKLGFGGSVISYPGTFDLVLNPFCYNTYKLLRKLRGGRRSFN
jgi:lipid II:glycine glycyltransferase (peptidoglycan interpeptide bridge formation enzyme)